MAGKARADMAGMPCRVTQRSNHRDACFYAEPDHQNVHAIHKAIRFVTPLGDDRVKQRVESALGRSTGFARRGRRRIKDE